MPRNADSAPSVPASTGAKRKRLEAVATDMPRLRIPVATRVRILELQEAGKTEEETHADLHAGAYRNAAGKAWGPTFSDEVGKIRRVRRAARDGYDDDDDRTTTSLIDAVEDGNLAAVQTLLDAGADVEGRGEYGYTALIEASMYGHLAIVKVLLAAGADVNAASYLYHTALMCASHHGHLDVVKALLAAGADVNAVSVEGATALIEACQHDCLAVVHTLLAAGANVNTSATYDGTALQTAVRRGHVAVARVLLATEGIAVAEEDRAWILEKLHEADEALVAKAIRKAAA